MCVIFKEYYFSFTHAPHKIDFFFLDTFSVSYMEKDLLLYSLLCYPIVVQCFIFYLWNLYNAPESIMPMITSLPTWLWARSLSPEFASVRVREPWRRRPRKSKLLVVVCNFNILLTTTWTTSGCPASHTNNLHHFKQAMPSNLSKRIYEIHILLSDSAWDSLNLAANPEQPCL